MNHISWGGKHIIKKALERTNLDATAADRNIKYCQDCNKCWEIDHGTKIQGVTIVRYYVDFPTRGKEREICIYCKE
jgi:hypothetical protein